MIKGEREGERERGRRRGQRKGEREKEGKGGRAVKREGERDTEREREIKLSRDSHHQCPVGPSAPWASLWWGSQSHSYGGYCLYTVQVPGIHGDVFP